jgi:hypothetical protein
MVEPVLKPLIEFKEHPLNTEWMSPLLDSRLKFIIYALAGFVWESFGKPITITSIYRAGDKGVHGYWRGIDIRSIYFTDDEIKEIKDFLNTNIVYGDNVHNTCVYHDVGQGIHFHIQVSSNDATSIQKNG